MADGSFSFVRTGALSIPAKFPVGNSGNIPGQMERLSPLTASFTISRLSWSKNRTKWMSVALRYFWTISTNFLLLFLPARDKLKSSQRSNIGRADVILNDKIRSEKKNATSGEQRLLIGNGGKNYRFQPLAETELRKFREFLFQPVGTEKLEYLAPPEVRPFVRKTFLWNRAFNLHLNRSNWKLA